MKSVFRRVLFCLLFLFAGTLNVQAATYYVDATGGSDSNNGTAIGSAWQTINKINTSTFSAGDNIYLKRGEVWREQLTFPSSGSSVNQITIGAYGEGTKPTIYGSSLLNGTWTQSSGNIYKISLATEAKVVVNGTNNLTLNDGGYAALTNNQWDWYNNELYVNIGSNPTGGTIEAGQRDYAIAVNSKNYLTIENIIERNTNSAGLHLTGTSLGIIVNNFEGYSNANESFKQTQSSSATYTNVIGNYNLDDGFSLHDSATATINGGTFNNNVSGIQNIYNSQINISNVTASNNSQHGFNVLYASGGVGGVSTISDSTFENNDMNIEVQDDQRVTIINATTTGGAYGINYTGSQPITISNVKVSSSTTSGIYANGTGSFTMNGESILTNNVKGIEIVGSQSASIDSATIISGSHGIYANTSNFITISKTQISSSTIAGINYLATGSGTVTVNDSKIFNTPTTTTAILAAGTGVFTINRCIITNITNHSIDVKAGSNFVANYSLFYKNLTAAKYVLVVRAGGIATVRNSVFHNNANGIYLYTPTTTLYNSILSSSTIAVKFDTNTPSSVLTLSNNDFFGNTTNFSTTTTNTNGLTSNPQFTDSVNGDFSLQSNSPLIDTGIDLGSDYLGAITPGSTWPNSVSTTSQSTKGSGWEIGAYIYLTNKAITNFTIPSQTSTTTINEGAHTVTLTVPYGTNVTALVPTISITGSSVSPASGVAQDFTSPVTYTVTADVGTTTQAYTVTVNVAANPSKAITNFTIPSQTGTTTINEGAHTISLNVPYGTDVTEIIPTISITGSSVSPASGVAQNFTSPVTYTVTAADSSTQEYVVTINVAASPIKAITNFTIPSQTGTTTINESSHTVTLTMPYGTNVTALIPTITINGASIGPASGVAQNFTSPVTYTVTAADSSTQEYVVTVNVAANPAKAITVFDLVTPDTTGVINETAHTITLTVPYGTNVTALVPTISITGSSVSPASGVAQDFTSPVTYTVTAANSSTQEYVVTVNVSADTAKAITAFDLEALSVVGVINETAHTITLTVPYGTNVTALVPTISITGSSVNPISSSTQDFTDPVVYTVTAANSSTQNYTVTVNVAANSAKSITNFTIPSQTGTTTINETAHTITLTVPYGTNVTALVPTISITGSSVSPASGVAQDFTSPVTYTVTAANSSTQEYVVTVNFTSPSNIATVTSTIYTVNNSNSTITNIPYGTTVSDFYSALTKGEPNQNWDNLSSLDVIITGDTLTVTAQDGSAIKIYTLTTLSLSSEKAIIGFSINSQVGTTTINETAHTIKVIMPYSTDITDLEPILTTNGSSTNPVSGTAQNFTNPVTYTVTADDSSTQNYTVTIIVLTSDQTAPDNNGLANISSTTPQIIIINPDQVVDITVDTGTLNPEIDVSQFISGGTGSLPKITLTSSNVEDIIIEIASSTEVTSASTTWDGIISAPVVTTVTLPETSGQTKTLDTAIEVGFTGVKLSFDRAVRILFPDKAGKRVGYIREGIDFTEITNICSGDNQTVGDALDVDSDCKKDVGSDLVVWTKHFTKFAVYDQTSDQTTSHSHSGSTISTTVPTSTYSEITTISEKYKFLNDLTFGSKGVDVIELQKRLISEGVYSGPVTGYYGILTVKAVRAYQLKNNLPQPGIVGPKTREILNKSQDVSIPQFIELLIQIGVIPSDKVEIARKIFGL